MAKACELRTSRQQPQSLQVGLIGSWTLQGDLPGVDGLTREVEGLGKGGTITFDTAALQDWDTGLLSFLHKLHDLGVRHEVRFDLNGLPQGVQRLLDLAWEVPERQGAKREIEHGGLLAHIGKETLQIHQSFWETVTFIGELTIALGRFFTGRARLQKADLFLNIQECGAQALPIVTLISLLVGLILAFVGAVQLQIFGAQIYIANLVGLGMARDMGAMMAGIIMAGRTGAAFAAQLGTMQVNEEIDALRTLGIPPMEFLVVPRLLALTMMLPILCVYADLMGILGGMLVGVGMFDISPTQYLLQTRDSVALHHFLSGVVKSGFYGVIVAVCGCLRGMQCGRSASAVGRATTSAVVTAIVWIIVCCAILTVIFHYLGF